jgi:hypothetical protein
MLLGVFQVVAERMKTSIARPNQSFLRQLVTQTPGSNNGPVFLSSCIRGERP